MAYVIGSELAKLNRDYTLDEVIKEVIHKLPKETAIYFLWGLEETYAKTNVINDPTKITLLVEAARFAKKIRELDPKSQIDKNAMKRVAKYEKYLADRGFYGYATEIAGLTPTEEAWKRVEGYIEKSTNNLRELPRIQDAKFGDKKVSEILEEKAKKVG